MFKSQAFGPFKLRRTSVSLAKTYLPTLEFRIWRQQSSNKFNTATLSTPIEYSIFMLLGSAAVWSSPGPLAPCQRLQGHDPGVVVEGVEMQGQALDQEQLSMEEGRGRLVSRERLQARPMRRQTANPPIISSHRPVRIYTTINHGGTRPPFPRRSRVTLARLRIPRARVGATQLWKTAETTSSA